MQNHVHNRDLLHVKTLKIVILKLVYMLIFISCVNVCGYFFLFFMQSFFLVHCCNFSQYFSGKYGLVEQITCSTMQLESADY